MAGIVSGGGTQNACRRGETHSMDRKGGILADSWPQDASSRPKTHFMDRRSHASDFVSLRIMGYLPESFTISVTPLYGIRRSETGHWFYEFTFSPQWAIGSAIVALASPAASSTAISPRAPFDNRKNYSYFYKN